MYNLLSGFLGRTFCLLFTVFIQRLIDVYLSVHISKQYSVIYYYFVVLLRSIILGCDPILAEQMNNKYKCTNHR